jgi:hypothetical protein
LDTQDAEQPAQTAPLRTVQEKPAARHARRQQYGHEQQALADSGATHLSRTAPDGRALSVAPGTEVGSTVQVAVSDKHQLRGEYEGTNA